MALVYGTIHEITRTNTNWMVRLFTKISRSLIERKGCGNRRRENVFHRSHSPTTNLHEDLMLPLPMTVPHFSYPSSISPCSAESLSRPVDSGHDPQPSCYWQPDCFRRIRMIAPAGAGPNRVLAPGTESQRLRAFRSKPGFLPFSHSCLRIRPPEPAIRWRCPWLFLLSPTPRLHRWSFSRLHPVRRC